MRKNKDPILSEQFSKDHARSYVERNFRGKIAVHAPLDRSDRNLPLSNAYKFLRFRAL